MPEATTPNYTHDAFISYSRKNEPFAHELQRALENFKPPKDLQAPQRYLEVFRDKEDFNAGDYFQNLENNLKVSAKLIVICSPAARASQYVNDEIQRFAQSRGAAHIVPILFAGIPNNEAKPGQEQEMAFPEALCKVMQMPLAVNYLNFKVGKDKVSKGIYADAWYTTLANVYEISRSEIEQREKRRRIRARRILFSTLTASVAVLSVLLVFALVSRNQAVNERKEADKQRQIAKEQAQIATTQRDAAVVAENLAEERRKEAVKQRGIAEEKTEEAKRERDIAEQRSKEAMASMYDTSAMRNFSEASTYDLRQAIEFDRSSKIRAEHDAIKPGADSATELRSKVLAEELKQYEDNIRSLRAHASDLRNRAQMELARADKQWTSLNNRPVQTLVGDRSRPAPPAIFSIEVLNASEGESLILHYGDLDHPRFILIDGGPRGVYESSIAPRLTELKQRFSGPAPLSLDLVIASQSDVERLQGITDLTNAMLQQSEKSSPDINITTVWFNHPLPVLPQFAEYLAPLPKWRLATNLLQLKIPVNAPFDYHVARPERGAIRVRYNSGLTITVLNPTPKTLVNFQKDFARRWRRPEVDLVFLPLAEETFSGAGREFIKPRKKEFIPLKENGTDRSVVNLASLVLMFEYHGKRFLYTSDANDYQVLEGLHEAGYLDSEGKVYVDVLHIPHYGSDRNVSEEFFRRVIAKQYIITGDGKFNNPETATLNMLTKARQNDVYSLQFAHRVGRENLGGKLDRFWESSLIDHSYRRIFRPPDEKSLLVNLLDPVRY